MGETRGREGDDEVHPFFFILTFTFTHPPRRRLLFFIFLSFFTSPFIIPFSLLQGCKLPFSPFSAYTPHFLYHSYLTLFPPLTSRLHLSLLSSFPRTSSSYL
ncbi:MAG: hypothetical protein JOS17DRAFT_709279 [Linnemannia elongata]|nr:MAG: hypothetical protein JOS17DRAFT_709279 [Linnemannia elongata]